MRRQFYDEKLPAEAVDAPSFESWLGRQPQKIVDKFRLARDNLVASEAAEDNAADFPAEIRLRNQTLKLDYVFDPGFTCYAGHL